MHVTGSKPIDGILIHSFFKEVDIPSVDKKGASVAEYLATVISLVVCTLLYKTYFWDMYSNMFIHYFQKSKSP